MLDRTFYQMTNLISNSQLTRILFFSPFSPVQLQMLVNFKSINFFFSVIDINLFTKRPVAHITRISLQNRIFSRPGPANEPKELGDTAD